MRIGIFTDSYYPEINGVATSCLMLRRELIARGHEVHVFAPQCRGWEDQQAENVHYLPSAPLILLKDRNFTIPFPDSVREGHEIPLDVVHTQSEFVMGYLGHHASSRLGCALVHTYHTAWEEYTNYLTHGLADEKVKAATRKYSKWWCNRFDRVIAPTGKTKDLLEHYGVRAPVDIIPSGMDIARFAQERHSAEDHAAVRAACGVREGERVLLYLGRMSKEKNIDQVMRAFAMAHDRLPDVRFVLIGEGPMRAALPEMAAQLGVADFVNVVGPKPWEEIDRWYGVGDVFCSASHSETQGLTYVEAMASGLCVCASADPCLDGVITDGVSGILAGQSDEELCAALLRAFSAEGQAIAKKSAAFAQPFGAAAFAAKVEECYRRAIEDHRKLAE